ncbi:hypothetical protein OS493_004719 [Desmophyllum pertusum]|uniref:CUB domain-containing protein n=1 Tax=Desmophyllum pertusum TaxID=174260 RepID=A0A9W9ZG62_9CNID|nr:hypothetical protein OS493_004719 [Desmophyllum pertusum]
MELCNKTVFLFFCLASVWLSVESMTKTQSLRSILDHFTSTRNVNVDPAAKQRARDFIVKTFKDHGLHSWTEEFKSNQDKYPGVNVVGQLPGRYTGTSDDKIVVIGSHYDSVQTSPGVDDNGSGITALLQALKLYTSPDKLNCSRDHTLLFVAFDLEESGLVGSDFFVQNLTQSLNNTGAGFQGAFVLENHPELQQHTKFPDVSPSVPELFSRKRTNNSRQISSEGTSWLLLAVHMMMQSLLVGYQMLSKKDENFKAIEIGIPASLRGRPSNWNPNISQYMRDFFRSDHYRFWNADPSLPAVFLTDSANFRGFMKQCYHRECDDISHVTPEMMTFLGRTTDSVVEVASNMTNEKCEVKQADCIEEKTADKGVIMTPYYNTQYPNKLHCAWTISVGGKDLRLKFTSFDLEESVNCTADYVNIRDGKDKTAPLIGRYCGKTPPEPVKASAQSLYIMFHTDELDAFKGFKAEWSLTPKAKSATQGNRPRMWQLIGFLVMTSLAIGL